MEYEPGMKDVKKTYLAQFSSLRTDTIHQNVLLPNMGNFRC